MDQKRLFLAIAASIAILLMFQFIMPHTPQPVSTPASTAQAPAPAGAAAVPAAGQTATGPAVPKQVPRVTIAGPRVAGSVSLLGARIDDVVLRNYHETIDTAAPWCACWSRVPRRSPTTSSLAGRPPRAPTSSCPTTIRCGAGRRGHARQAGGADLGQRRRPNVRPRHLRR